MLKVGDKAPDFTLSDHNGNKVSLSDFKGQKVLIFFYSKDCTSGCVRHSMGFSASVSKYENLNIKVMGISKDSVVSHKRFADRYKLNITLLSDEGREVIEKYHVSGEKKKGDVIQKVTIRSSFLIDEKGFISVARYKVKADTDSGEILKMLETVNAKEF